MYIPLGQFMCIECPWRLRFFHLDCVAILQSHLHVWPSFPAPRVRIVDHDRRNLILQRLLSSFLIPFVSSAQLVERKGVFASGGINEVIVSGQNDPASLQLLR